MNWVSHSYTKVRKYFPGRNHGFSRQNAGISRRQDLKEQGHFAGQLGGKI